MRHGRRDNTHAETRDGLRDVYGEKAVLDTADLGDGFPDLVLGARGVTMFLEVKRDKKQGLRPKQLEAKLDAQLKAGLDAKDTESGTGYGGPVANAAHGAAQGSLAPQAGFATFDVQTDASGTITGVKLVDFNADKAGWEYVASGMRKTLSTLLSLLMLPKAAQKRAKMNGTKK